MQRSRRLRRGLAAVFVAAATPALSSCASGFDSPVLQSYNPSVGVHVRDTPIYALNMLVVLSESGNGTLVGALLNKTNRPDALVAATVESEPDEQRISSSMLEPTVPLPPERLVNLSETPTVAVRGDVTPGRFVTLTLTFQSAEQIEVKIPVVAPEGPYEEVPLPGESPSPETTASPTEAGTASPTEGGTASPAESPTRGEG